MEKKSQVIMTNAQVLCIRNGIGLHINAKGQTMLDIEGHKVKLSAYVSSKNADQPYRIRVNKKTVDFLGLSEKDYIFHENWAYPYEITSMDVCELRKRILEKSGKTEAPKQEEKPAEAPKEEPKEETKKEEPKPAKKKGNSKKKTK